MPHSNTNLSDDKHFRFQVAPWGPRLMYLRPARNNMPGYCNSCGVGTNGLPLCRTVHALDIVLTTCVGHCTHSSKVCVMVPSPISWFHVAPSTSSSSRNLLKFPIHRQSCLVGTFRLYFYLLRSLALQQENHSSHCNRSCNAKPRPELGSWSRPGQTFYRESWASSADRLSGFP